MYNFFLVYSLEMLECDNLYPPGSGAHTEGRVTDFKAVYKLTRLDLIWFDSCPDFRAQKGKAGWPQGPRPGARRRNLQLPSGLELGTRLRSGSGMGGQLEDAAAPAVFTDLGKVFYLSWQ